MIKATRELLIVIKNLEGCRLSTYLDSAGIPTIGIGHLITPSEKTNGTFNIPLSGVDSALNLLAEDIEKTERLMDKIVGDLSLPQHQIDALLSFSFNVGAGAFSRSTLNALLHDGNTDECVKQFSRWVYAGNKPYAGLVKRRVVEAGLFSFTSDVDTLFDSEMLNLLSSNQRDEAIKIIEGYLNGQTGKN